MSVLLPVRVRVLFVVREVPSTRSRLHWWRMTLRCRQILIAVTMVGRLSAKERGRSVPETMRSRRERSSERCGKSSVNRRFPTPSGAARILRSKDCSDVHAWSRWRLLVHWWSEKTTYVARCPSRVCRAIALNIPSMGSSHAWLDAPPSSSVRRSRL